MKGVVAISILLLCKLNTDCVASSTECRIEESTPENLRVSIRSSRNQTGKWLTEFIAYKKDLELEEDDGMVVEVSQDVVDCGGRKTLVVRGKIIGSWPSRGNNTDKEYSMETLLFHPKSGANSVVINNGLTVEKIVLTESGYAAAFTSRPLKDDELFEVILKRKTNHFSNALGLGVSPYSPANMAIPKDITFMIEPIWSYYHGNSYHNRNTAKSNYGVNLDTTVEVGDRVGIKRSSNGDLHYFVKGKDQGVAATGLPKRVYGIIDLYGSAARVSVVKS